MRGGPKSATKGRYWYAADDDRLRKLTASGVSPGHIADLMKRTRKAIWARRTLLGLKPDRWTPDEDRTLIVMKSRGCAARDVAGELGRTAHAVDNRIALLRAKGISFSPQRAYDASPHLRGLRP